MKRPTLFSPAPLLCCTLAAALGLGAGWLIHRARDSPRHLTSSAGEGTDPPDQSDQFSPTKRPAGGKSQASSAATPDAKNNALAEALATSPRIERWLLLVVAAENATPDEMPGLLRLCVGDNAALRMVAARWAELNPAHMWQTLRGLTVGTETGPGRADASGFGLPSYDLAQLLFESWTPRDPSAIIASLSAAKNFPGIDRLRMNALEALVKTDPESALRAMRDWESRRYIPRMDAVRAWAEKNPQYAAGVAAKIGATAGGREALTTIGKAWASSDPQAALAYAATLPTMQNRALAAGAMVEWAGRDAKAAAAYVTALPDATLRAGLAPFLVETWAKAAPQQALDWAQATLRGEARVTALGSIVGSIARQDVTRAAELVAGLDPGGSKNKAIASLVEPWFQKDGAAPVAEWLLKLPEADAREAGFEKLGFQWLWNSGREGALKAAELAIGPQRDLVPNTFVAQVASNEARHDPEAAMKWVGQLPADRIPQTRDRVLSEWMQTRPEAAAQWVLKQPAGDTRRDLITSATRNLAWNNTPGSAHKFFSQLPAAERALAVEILSSTTLPEEKRLLLEAALAKP